MEYNIPIDSDFLPRVRGEEKHYQERDIEALGNYYLAHVAAMTKESLRSKSDIAAELAYRDQIICEQTKQIKLLREALEKLARLGNGEHYGNSIGNEIAIKALAAPEPKK